MVFELLAVLVVIQGGITPLQEPFTVSPWISHSDQFNFFFIDIQTETVDNWICMPTQKSTPSLIVFERRLGNGVSFFLLGYLNGASHQLFFLIQIFYVGDVFLFVFLSLFVQNLLDGKTVCKVVESLSDISWYHVTVGMVKLCIGFFGEWNPLHVLLRRFGKNQLIWWLLNWKQIINDNVDRFELFEKLKNIHSVFDETPKKWRHNTIRQIW